MNAKPFRDYYSDLGLEYGASHTAIKNAFFALAKRYHPDKTGIPNSSEFRSAREAYEILSDTAKRKTYDWSYRTATSENENRGQDSESTRTEAYEAEMAEERPSSPRPPMPFQYARQSTEEFHSSPRYKEWRAKDDAHRARHPNRDQE